MKPLVSVICICYNQERFVREAIESVWDQRYSNIELVMADDFSTDHSADVIRGLMEEKPQSQYFINHTNIGHNRTFNKALEKTKGAYIIDLAADDVLNPGRVEVGLDMLEKRGAEFGVHFSDAEIIDENSRAIGLHSQSTSSIRKLNPVPEGDVFSSVVGNFFICPPTLMVRREVYEHLNGYDESLDYEDFDFLVRSSRDFKYCYSEEVLVKRRLVRGSKSEVQLRKGHPYFLSTLNVCKKALSLVRNNKESEALANRLKYECRQLIRNRDMELVAEYIDLMKKNEMSAIDILPYQFSLRLLR